MTSSQRYLLICFIPLLLSVSLPTLRAGEQPFGLNEQLGVHLPDGIRLLNEDSEEADLSDLITRPTLLSFVYYKCPSLCPKMLEGIAELVNYSHASPDNDYQIITLSIDQNESSTLAGTKKAYYYSLIRKEISPGFWRFYTADSTMIRKLTNAVGWEFRKEGENFVHTTSTVLITPSGMVSQYFYGTYFNYMHFDMSVEKAWQEEIVPTRLKTLKYCYNYIPPKNRRVELITMIFGISILAVVLILFVVLVSGRKRRIYKNQVL